jgi:hypothetical protein
MGLIYLQETCLQGTWLQDTARHGLIMFVLGRLGAENICNVNKIYNNNGMFQNALELYNVVKSKHICC